MNLRWLALGMLFGILIDDIGFGLIMGFCLGIIFSDKHDD
jgi:hypothetical protein